MLQGDHLTPQQRAVLKARTPMIIIHGGVGTFKTTGCIIRLYYHCHEYPGQFFLVLAQTWDAIMGTFIKEWETQIPESEYLLNLNAKSIKMRNCDSEIRLHYADHRRAAGRLRGLSITGWYITQAEQIQNEELFHVLQDRVRKWGKEPNLGYLRMLDANPGAPGHWVHELFIDESNRRYLSKEMVSRIRVRTTPETSAYSAETLDEWRRIKPGYLYQRDVEGEWTAAEGRVWDYYELFKHPAENMKFHAAKYDRIVLGCDQGQTDPTAIIFLGYKNGIWDVFDEYVAVNKSVRNCLEQVRIRLASWGLDPMEWTGIIWVDPSAKQWVNEWNEIADCKITAYQSMHYGTNPVYNRALKLGEMFRTKRLYLNDLCQNAIQDCERTTWKGGSKDEIDKKAYNPHTMDAIGYAIIKEA